jgi:pyrroline-5-carboxylate reductase
MGLIYTRYLSQQQLFKKEDLLLVEKNESRRRELQAENIRTVEFPEEGTIENSDLVLLAVKPQDFDEVAFRLKGRLRGDCLVISIMAGFTIDSIRQKLQVDRVVRAMPNAAALYGQGMTVFCYSESVHTEQKQMAEDLLSVTGRIVETKKEDHLNAVTAISGSGPAYFFFFAKQLIDSAVALGIDEVTATLLVQQTLSGASAMIEQSGKSCEELIKTVASKGGTTEAALKVLHAKLPDIIAEATSRATNRAYELSV